MPLSLKGKLKVWAAALRAYDQEDFATALDLFSRIPKSSIIFTNMGLIHAALGEHEAAVGRFIQATLKDPYLAVAYFQCGVSNFLLQHYDLAYRDFREALRHLRDNQTIDYEQIGLNFKLFPAEVLFNKGLCLILLGQLHKGLADLESARELKATKDHDIIDDAIRRCGRGYTVFSIPRGICYRPSEKKLEGAKSRDFMGEARLIAAIDLDDTSTGFSGVERMRLGRSATTAKEKEPRRQPGPLPRSASLNDLKRSRQTDAGLFTRKFSLKRKAPVPAVN
ncbi:P-type phospholipid transporter [Mycena sanguinolenta]|uniref:P-type phospholipid transporter n=1 Tax=Mycena sanguinolenta TaxID=230812 RepID=A0A8H7CMW4_9AGAR|nr:P-type phospholipid transporter [Mycena sanguinolenta]